MFALRHLTSAAQLNPSTLEQIFSLADALQSQDSSRNIQPMLQRQNPGDPLL